MTRTYATPAAFKQALEQKLADEARRTGQPLVRVRQMLVFDRFLARVFELRAASVIVKGGVVLELRLGRARTTRDIDLWWSGAASDVLEQLRDAARLALEPLTFDVDRDRAHPDLTAAGMKYDGLRFRVQGRLAGKPFGDPFGVDVAFAEPIAEPADEIVGRDLLAFAGVPTPRFRVYPRTTHLAEKLHALTLPRTTPNSRVKDLPDLALLALAGPLDGLTLRAAIERTFAHRATHAVPSALPASPTSWAPVYERMARNDDLRWRTLGELEHAAARSSNRCSPWGHRAPGIRTGGAGSAELRSAPWRVLMEKTEGSRRPSRDGWMGAGLGCGVALLGGIALGGAAQLAVVRGIGNPESLGRATVYAALAVLALAAGSGVAWALRARRSAAMAAVVALTLTVAPLGAAVRGPDRFPYPPPNEEERSPPQPFERDGTQVWIQPALGLELLAPEGLRLQQSDGLPVPTTTDPSDDSASIQWSWTNDSRDRALIILVALTIAYDDPGQNARYVDGVLTGELEGLGPAGFAVLEAERRGPSEQVVLAQHDLLGTVFMRTVAYRHGDALVMVTATAMGRQHTHLIPVVESVRGRPEYTTPP